MTRLVCLKSPSSNSLSASSSIKNRTELKPVCLATLLKRRGVATAMSVCRPPCHCQRDIMIMECMLQPHLGVIWSDRPSYQVILASDSDVTNFGQSRVVMAGIF